MHIMVNDTPDRNILPIIKVSTTLGRITMLYAPGTYTQNIHPWYYQGQPDLAL
jgi:hypothetical protein